MGTTDVNTIGASQEEIQRGTLEAGIDLGLLIAGYFAVMRGYEEVDWDEVQRVLTRVARTLDSIDRGRMELVLRPRRRRATPPLA